MEMLFRTFTEDEEKLIRRNCRVYDYLFRMSKRKCANKQCNFPLPAGEEGYYSSSAGGRVCDLCHTMEDAVNQFPGLRAAQEEWKLEQTARNRVRKFD